MNQFLRTAAVLTLMTAQAAAAQSSLSLGANWRLQSSAKIDAPPAVIASTHFTPEGWYETSLPKTVLAALVEAGVYPDPYYDLNLKNIPGYRDGLWLVMPEDSPFHDSWWYRLEFTVPPDHHRDHYTLHFDGLNYAANIWLNGVQIAGQDTARGMFRRFAFPITKVLLPDGNNVLAVEIIPPGRIPDRNYGTKQVQATTGWDDHNPQPPDMNMGLWEAVHIRAHGPVRLSDPYVQTHLSVPGLEQATLTPAVFLHNVTELPVTGALRVTIDAPGWQTSPDNTTALATLEKQVALEPGAEHEALFAPEDFEQLVVQSPAVWWPHPVGDQPLYRVRFSFHPEGASAPSDSTHTRFGIREITTTINDEDWRHYTVNGRDILIRGGAWMTSDMMLNLDHDRYDALIRYARDAHLNMLRSEGFSIRETKEFYDLCDEYGVMVTQQLFGRSIPDEALAIANIDDMMRRIRPHPSLAHFLGHDETYPTDTLDEAYQQLIERYRLDRTYQPHSGTFVVTTRAQTGGTRTGSREVWTYASPSHYYLREHDGAWGFAQSGGIGGIVAPEESIRAMMAPEQLWPALETEAWSFHSVTQGAIYFDAFRKAMEANYGAPDTLEDFLRKAYAMNYNSARGMYEAYARNKYRATGITTWKYNAAWPAAITWQYIDWYLRPTAAYFGAKKACETVHVQYAYDDDQVYVVNSLYQEQPALRVTAALYDFDLRKVWEKEATVTVGEDDTSAAFALETPADISTTHFLRLFLFDHSGREVSRNFYWLSTSQDVPGTVTERGGVFQTRPKSVADFTALAGLKPAHLQIDPIDPPATPATGPHAGATHAWLVTNTGDTLAFMIHLTLPDDTNSAGLAPQFWSDNYFSLLPGESRAVTLQIPAYGRPPTGHPIARSWSAQE